MCSAVSALPPKRKALCASRSLQCGPFNKPRCAAWSALYHTCESSSADSPGPVARVGPPSDDNNVFVKGFDRSQGEEAVREALTTLFSDAGEVANVRLPTDRETGELKGFGFIEFADNAGKARARVWVVSCKRLETAASAG